MQTPTKRIGKDNSGRSIQHLDNFGHRIRSLRLLLNGSIVLNWQSALRVTSWPIANLFAELKSQGISMQLLPKLFQTIPMLCLLLTGCASISEVKNKDRDLSNSYDGIWIAKYQTTKRYQKYSNWTFTCPQVTTPLWMEINNSGIRTSVNYEYIAPLNEAYISSTGTLK